MANASEQRQEVTWRLGEGPFFLKGSPPKCVGRIRVINEGPETVKVSDVKVGDLDFGTPTLHKPERIKTLARLRPRSGATVIAQCEIHPHTPPGLYEGYVYVGEQREKLVVHVRARHRVRLVPSRISIQGIRARQVTSDLYIRNEGNVPFRIPEKLGAPLEEDNRDRVHRGIVVGLAEAGEEGYEPFLNKLVKHLANTQGPPVDVDVSCDDPYLPPGQTRKVELQIHVPSKLDRSKRYLALLLLDNTRLTLEIEEVGSSSKKTGRPT